MDTGEVKVSDPPWVLVVQHVACETLGTIEMALEAQGLKQRTIRVHEGDRVPSQIGDASGLIVMGGPMSVNDAGKEIHLMQEMRLMESALASHRPVLGICLGCQLLAHVLGAKVYPGPGKELGWHSVSLREAAREDPLWAELPTKFQAFHWHGDIFDLPPAAVSLAHSEATACQAFRYGGNAYGILFHMEVTDTILHDVATTFGEELDEIGLAPEQLERDSAHYLGDLTRMGSTVFNGWAKLLAASVGQVRVS